jgi:hypothetical protein
VILKKLVPALIGCLCLCAQVSHSQPNQVSTAAPAQVQSPLFLTISKDSYSSRVGLDYRIRWDFSDLRSFRPGLGFLYSGIKAVYNWDITENTRLEYYGFRTNPWRIIISKGKKEGAAPEDPAAAGALPGDAVGSPVVTPPAHSRRRIRFSLSPLVEDFKNNFDEGLRNYLLMSSMKGLTPEWEKAGQSGRKAFMKDVLSLGLWDSSVPLMKETAEGLEYISEDGDSKVRRAAARD